MSDLVLLTGEQERFDYALAFAKTAHGAQVRRYTGEPYWTHPYAVACLVSQVRNRSIEMLEASLLHDVLEDTDTTADAIELHFSMLTRAYVEALSEVPYVKGGPNRAERKQMMCDRMLTAPWAVKTIRIADLIHNTHNIVAYDPKYARIYLAEKSNMLNYLLGGDQALWSRARTLADQPI